MKLLTYLKLAMLTLLAACSDSPEPKPAFSLVGSWKLINITATGCTDPALSGSNSNFACPPKTQLQSCTTYTFTSNSVNNHLEVYFNGVINEGDDTGTYSQSGDQIKITWTSNGVVTKSTGTASLSGNILTINWAKNSTSGCTTTDTFEKI